MNRSLVTAVGLIATFCNCTYGILAGGENSLPLDFPSNRLDQSGPESAFNFVGALSITDGVNSFIGSASAINNHWVLSAGHNFDYDDDGIADESLTVNFNIPGFGSYTADSYVTAPEFTGFLNPSLHNDLALLFFNEGLPNLNFPALGISASVGEELTLVGFGRSGFGDYGYTTPASLTDRRVGRNIFDSVDNNPSDIGSLFRYDFDSPETAGLPYGSLGNEVETLIGPGDSGGPALLAYGDHYGLVGVNTFSEGFGGIFGDNGGGVLIDANLNWISQTTGIALIPEASSYSTTMISVLAAYYLVFLRRFSTRR